MKKAQIDLNLNFTVFRGLHGDGRQYVRILSDEQVYTCPIDELPWNVGEALIAQDFNSFLIGLLNFSRMYSNSPRQ